MRRVIALELVGLEQLEYDLYDESGHIVYKKNTILNPEILMKLSYIKLFKRDEYAASNTDNTETKTNIDKNLLQQKPKAILKEFLGYYELPEKEKNKKPVECNSVIKDDKKESIKKTIKAILGGVHEKSTPKISSIIEATEIILDEVYTKVDILDNVNRLRVHDYYTYSHSINVAILAAIIGREIGLSENKVKDLTFSGLLHDIGKMLIPKEILFKPGELTPLEFKKIKNHTSLGYEYIINKMEYPDYVARAALEHHEKWNGTGYPKGLKQDEISQFGQIIAIADVYDALISDKIYRDSISPIDAVKLMLTEESQSFNPKILYKFSFLSVLKK